MFLFYRSFLSLKTSTKWTMWKHTQVKPVRVVLLSQQSSDMCLCVFSWKKHTQITVLYFGPLLSFTICLWFPACPGAKNPLWVLSRHTHTHNMIMTRWVSAALENVSGEKRRMRGKCLCVREIFFSFSSRLGYLNLCESGHLVTVFEHFALQLFAFWHYFLFIY